MVKKRTETEQALWTMYERLIDLMRQERTDAMTGMEALTVFKDELEQGIVECQRRASHAGQ